MLWAIFSDVHSNLPALDAVLESIDRDMPDRLMCLGDMVGYGARPHEVVARIRELGCVAIVGNHDLAAIGRLDTSCFNSHALEAVQWTRNRLTRTDREYISELPLSLDVGLISAVHATRDFPDEFQYLQSMEQAKDLLEEQPRFLGVFGHTHVPLSFLRKEGEVVVKFDKELDLTPFDRVLVNVGSVGQPRDEDARAAYVLFDDVARSLSIRRVEYDIEESIRNIHDAGLPAILGERLRFGL